MTYGELNRSSNRIAMGILDAVGHNEEPVAVLCRHDVPVIAAILGILKAGKFYLPMDADWPEQRASTIVLTELESWLMMKQPGWLLSARQRQDFKSWDSCYNSPVSAIAVSPFTQLERCRATQDFTLKNCSTT